MRNRLICLCAALIMLLCLIPPVALADDTVNFEYYYSNGVKVTSTAGLRASMTVSAGSTVTFTAYNTVAGAAGFEFVSASPSSYTSAAATATASPSTSASPAPTPASASVTVKVTVKQMAIWPSISGNSSYPGYPSNGVWYGGNWYPNPSYLGSTPWNMPDVTYTWNGTTYTIPGRLVYEWLQQGQQMNWNRAQVISQPLSGSSASTSVAPPSPNLYVGGGLQLSSNMIGGIDPFSYYTRFSSSEPYVATVSDTGFILGINAGSTRITAYDGGGRVFGVWDVVVALAPRSSAITLNYSKYTLRRNADLRLIAYEKGVPIYASWTSSNPSVGTVDADGWVTTYDKKGRFTVTAYVTGGSSKKCVITVK